jgi:hypothetical protein
MTEAVALQRKISPTRLRRAEEARTVYFEVIPDGMVLQDAMNADYWQHVRKYLRLYDIFEVVAADGTYDATFRLTYINNLTGEMRFRLLSLIEADGSVQAIVSKKDDRFMVAHKGFGRYAVIEKSTGTLVADGLTKEMAVDTQQKAEIARAK